MRNTLERAPVTGQNPVDNMDYMGYTDLNDEQGNGGENNVQGSRREGSQGFRGILEIEENSQPGRTEERGGEDRENVWLDDPFWAGRSERVRLSQLPDWARHGLEKPKEGSAAYEMAKQAESYGLPWVVIKPQVWEKQGFSDPAASKDGIMYCRSDISEEYRKMIVPHEGTHIMRQVGYGPYLSFIEKTPDYIRFGTDGAKYLLSVISNHIKLNDSTRLTRNGYNRLYDELNATIMGHIAAGNLTESQFALVRSAFYNFDAYINELTEIYRQFQGDLGRNKGVNGDGSF